jgi:hypothetical protein
MYISYVTDDIQNNTCVLAKTITQFSQINIDHNYHWLKKLRGIHILQVSNNQHTN